MRAAMQNYLSTADDKDGFSGQLGTGIKKLFENFL